MRVLHLTDPHLFADAGGELRGANTQASLQSVLAHYSESGWRADRVVVTGDLIQDDSAGAYRRFRDLMLPLNLRVHCVPGNHDVPDLMQTVCRVPPFSYCAWEEIGDWLVVGLDSFVPDTAGGEVGAAEIERLTTILDESSARHALVCLHHPPVTMNSAWLDSVGLANGPALLATLASLGRVRAVIFGHVHQAYDDLYEGIRVLGTPSTCRQFRPGSNDFAVDDKPPAYRRIELGADGSVTTELVWVAA